MELVLDVVLEHADIDVLLDCVFVSTHVHRIVMRILTPELQMLKRFSEECDGDIYEGIRRFGAEPCVDGIPVEIQHQEYKRVRRRLMSMYVRLYPFNIDTEKHADTYTDFMCLEEFVDDFAGLVDKYYYKMGIGMIGALVLYVMNVWQYEYIIKAILEKGFDFNRVMWISASSKTTILNHAIRKYKFAIIDTVLDYNPDLFVYDSIADNAKMLFKRYLMTPEFNNSGLNSGKVPAMIEKFKALLAVQEQKRKFPLTGHT